MPAFRHPHRVVYSECTLGNHIYYGRFLDLFEEARGEFLRSVGLPFLALQERGLLLPVLEADVRYAGPVRYDDLIHVEVTPTILGRLRLEFAYRVMGPADDVRVTGRTLHVATNLEDRPQRLPPDLVAALGAIA
ncbi:MAG: thioesterase family protein [Verrucomicrobiota bacterium]|jgi:acyl-CoA thioester hydrolase